MPHDVFISYSSKDKLAADALCAALEAARIRCWVAPRDVVAGLNYSGQITRAVQGTKIVVLVFSEHSNMSSAVLAEVELAAHSHVHILNFRVDSSPLGDDLRFYLQPRHWIDALTPPMEFHHAQLVRSIKTLLGHKASDESDIPEGAGGGSGGVPPPPVKPGKPVEAERSRRGGMLATLLLLAVLCVAGLGYYGWHHWRPAMPALTADVVPLASASPAPNPAPAGFRPGTAAGEQRTFEIAPGMALDVVWCPPGSFEMGSPEREEGRQPQEPLPKETYVRFTKGFWLGKFEVTREQYIALTGTKPGYFSNAGGKAPVESVTYAEAQAFCEKLTALLRQTGQIPAGYSFRLPTEKEWEYACRAGNREIVYSVDGDQSWKVNRNGTAAALDTIAWYRGNSAVTYAGGLDLSDGKASQDPASYAGPHPVGASSLRPNAWGLHDMIGNVYEFCSNDLPSGRLVDGKTQAAVLRGGSWYNGPNECRAASRWEALADQKASNVGFRLALVADSKVIRVPGDYPKIQAAINAAAWGDTVRVAAGIYQEALDFKEGIQLIGDGMDKTIVRYPITEGDVIDIHSCRDGLIRDIGFEHFGENKAEKRHSVISLKRSGVTLLRCAARGSGSTGIFSTEEDRSTVIDGESSNCFWFGIDVSTGAKPRLIHNRCDSNQAGGIRVQQKGTAPFLIRNEARGNVLSGIVITWGAVGVAEANICEGNGQAGISVTQPGTAPVLTRNEARSNKDDGIAFRTSAGGSAENNTCENNGGAGIGVYNSDTKPVLRGNSGDGNADCGILVKDAKPEIASDNKLNGLQRGKLIVE